MGKLKIPEIDLENSLEPTTIPEEAGITLFWTTNVKYRGKRHKAGSKADVVPADIEPLLAGKIVRRAEV